MKKIMLDDELTPREIQVIQLAAKGLKNKQIADKLFVSVRTVDTHFQHIYSKFGVNDRSSAINAAFLSDYIH